MRTDWVPLVLAILVALAFIGGGYQEGPHARWGKDGQGKPISLRSRWILGCSFVGLAVVFIPTVRAQLPSSMPTVAVVGLLLLVFLMMLLDSMPFERRSFRRPLHSGLSRQQKQEIRRERKRQRLRRTQTRRDS